MTGPSQNILFRPLRITPAMWALLLALAGWAYYATYWRCGFLISDEGSVALLSQRLLEGERPFRDMEMGYNLLWFYPISAIFGVVGPDFLAMRAWFFCLAALTSILVFFSVRKFGGRDFPALIAALLVLAIPGSTYKTYIPLAIVANSACLLWLARQAADGSRILKATISGGIALGLATLVRVDLGYPLLAVWLVALALVQRIEKTGWRSRMGKWARSVGLVVGIAAAVHVPFIVTAYVQGWLPDWGRHYGIVYNMYTQPLASLAKRFQPEQKKPAENQANQTRTDKSGKPKANRKTEQEVDSSWRRAPLSDLWKSGKKTKFRDREWALLAYAPLLTGGVLLLLGGIVSFAGDRRKALLGVGVASVAAASFAAFPQFFFYRPDAAHLSEFMPGMLLAIGAAVSVLPAISRRLVAVLLSLWLVIHTAFWADYGISSATSGGFIQRAFGTDRFVGKNGIDVLVPYDQLVYLEGVTHFVETHSKPGDFMVCYPYWPGLNFACDRPTYAKYLYADNLTAGRRWHDRQLEELSDRKPSIVVTNDWAIHGNDASRFSNWAPRVVQYLQENYPTKATVQGFKLYALKPETETGSTP